MASWTGGSGAGTKHSLSRTSNEAKASSNKSSSSGGGGGSSRSTANFSTVDNREVMVTPQGEEINYTPPPQYRSYSTPQRNYTPVSPGSKNFSSVDGREVLVSSSGQENYTPVPTTRPNYSDEMYSRASPTDGRPQFSSMYGYSTPTSDVEIIYDSQITRGNGSRRIPTFKEKMYSDRQRLDYALESGDGRRQVNAALQPFVEVPGLALQKGGKWVGDTFSSYQSPFRYDYVGSAHAGAISKAGYTFASLGEHARTKPERAALEFAVGGAVGKGAGMLAGSGLKYLTATGRVSQAVRYERYGQLAMLGVGAVGVGMAPAEDLGRSLPVATGFGIGLSSGLSSVAPSSIKFDPYSGSRSSGSVMPGQGVDGLGTYGTGRSVARITEYGVSRDVPLEITSITRGNRIVIDGKGKAAFDVSVNTFSQPFQYRGATYRINQQNYGVITPEQTVLLSGKDIFTSVTRYQPMITDNVVPAKNAPFQNTLYGGQEAGIGRSTVFNIKSNSAFGVNFIGGKNYGVRFYARRGIPKTEIISSESAYNTQSYIQYRTGNLNRAIEIADTTFRLRPGEFVPKDRPGLAFESVSVPGRSSPVSSAYRSDVVNAVKLLQQSGKVTKSGGYEAKVPRIGRRGSYGGGRAQTIEIGKLPEPKPSFGRPNRPPVPRLDRLPIGRTMVGTTPKLIPAFGVGGAVGSNSKLFNRRDFRGDTKPQNDLDVWSGDASKFIDDQERVPRQETNPIEKFDFDFSFDGSTAIIGAGSPPPPFTPPTGVTPWGSFGLLPGGKSLRGRSSRSKTSYSRSYEAIEGFDFGGVNVRGGAPTGGFLGIERRGSRKKSSRKKATKKRGKR